MLTAELSNYLTTEYTEYTEYTENLEDDGSGLYHDSLKSGLFASKSFCVS